MKLKNLDKELTTISGARIMLTKDKPLTYRASLVSSCEMYRPTPGAGEAIKAYQIGMRILDAKTELDIEAEELILLKKIVENNEALVAVVAGKLLEYLNN